MALNIIELKRQYAELGREAGVKLKAVNEGRITVAEFTRFMNGPNGNDGAVARDKELETHIKAYHAAQQLSGIGGAPIATSGKPKGAQVAPLAFDEMHLKALHDAVTHKSSYAITTKGFSTVDSLLPAQLSPQVVGPQYEGRLLDYLPVQFTDAPAWEYIRHTSTTLADGVTASAPGIVAEGAAKPELVMQTDKIVVLPQKIAAHTAVSWEVLSDYAAFVEYVQQEIMRQIVNVETNELLNGDGTTGHLPGLLSTSGILTHAVGTDTPLDAVEISIAALRTGTALAEANLLVLHPNTWSALRRTKDNQNRYLVDPDPTNAGGNQLWGVTVLPTTKATAGVGTLLDTNKFGYVILRESVSLRTGTANDDVIRNLQRFVGETRLTLAVERPSAVLKLTGLPTS